jgi:hypothetical protein
MTPSRYPRSKSVSDDRPTTPPPFDVEAFARQSITMDSDDPPKVEPIAQRGPQGVPGTTTPPVTLSSGPLRPPLAAGVRRTSIAWVGIAVLGMVVLGGASVVGGGRTRAAARRISATVRAVAPASNATVVDLPPDLPVVLTVVRTAATPSAVRALPPKVVPPASATSASPRCQPPYVIDAETGKKHWKLECL